MTCDQAPASSPHPLDLLLLRKPSWNSAFPRIRSLVIERREDLKARVLTSDRFRAADARCGAWGVRDERRGGAAGRNERQIEIGGEQSFGNEAAEFDVLEIQGVGGIDGLVDSELGHCGVPVMRQG